MARISWGSQDERRFETGVDRGVLYAPGWSGVPWNGLKSVNEEPSGGEPRPFYVDGYKYLNVATAEEYSATLEAFSSPLQFGPCDGTVGIANGLFATQQPRLPFNLAYRTLVGNAVEGTDYGYKIHLVYNALASPSQKSNTSLSGSASPLSLSWKITTTPPKMTGRKPTAHLVVDSTRTHEELVQVIEDILYGTDSAEARMPDVDELITIFTDFVPSYSGYGTGPYGYGPYGGTPI